MVLREEGKVRTFVDGRVEGDLTSGDEAER